MVKIKIVELLDEIIEAFHWCLEFENLTHYKTEAIHWLPGI